MKKLLSIFFILSIGTIYSQSKKGTIKVRTNTIYGTWQVQNTTITSKRLENIDTTKYQFKKDLSYTKNNTQGAFNYKNKTLTLKELHYETTFRHQTEPIFKTYTYKVTLLTNEVMTIVDEKGNQIHLMRL